MSGYTFTRETKAPNVSTRNVWDDIHPDFAKALEAEWAYHQTDPNVNHIIDLPDAKSRVLHSGHARAWGNLRDQHGAKEKVDVRTLPPRKDEPAGRLRLQLMKFDPNAPKKGRKPKPIDNRDG